MKPVAAGGLCRTAVQALVDYFSPAPRTHLLSDPAERVRATRHWRWRVFLTITLGYGFFYTTRLGLSVTKKPLLDHGVMDAVSLGRVGSALLLGYALGKSFHGFLCDRVHLRRFFVTGLLLSALTNLLFGLASSPHLFLALWGLNGWFQSVGATVSGVSLACWFPPRELGTRYALWSLSHNLGEGLTFAGTAVLVSTLGWRWGFLGPGLLCLLVGLVLSQLMADRPPSVGLLPPNEPGAEEEELSISQLQRAATRNPMVWLLGLSSACLYVARYAINNWGVLYLQVDRGYSLLDAGLAVSLVPLVGTLGTVSSGVISDHLFAGRRGPVSLAYGMLLVLALSAVLLMPPAHPALLAAALGTVGFAVGGQMVFLGGLAAIELCSKRASGAVMGIVGGLSYIGAAGQDLVSGALIQNGATADFTQVKYFWVGAACLSVLLSVPLLRVSQHHQAPTS